MEVPNRLASLVVLFVLTAILVDDSACARRLLDDRPLPVMSHLPEITPTLPKPDFAVIPKVSLPPPIEELPRFPKIGWPEFPKGSVLPEAPKCPEKPQEPQVPENSKSPEVYEAPNSETLSAVPPEAPNDQGFLWPLGGPVLPSSTTTPTKNENSPPATASGAP